MKRYQTIKLLLAIPMIASIVGLSDLCAFEKGDAIYRMKQAYDMLYPDVTDCG
jgi:hypothetical protein